jgi:peroxiredoxin
MFYSVQVQDYIRVPPSEFSNELDLAVIGQIKLKYSGYISKDLPFAQARFCGAEGLENVETLSDFRSNFGMDYNLQIVDGPLAGLASRAVVVVDENGKVVYTQQVSEIVDEPNYEEVLNVIK